METLTAQLFTKPTAKNGNIMERVKTFEDACEVLGIYPKEISMTVDFGHNDDAARSIAAVAAFAKLLIIVRALNEGWVPDWSDERQHKYYPWFKMSSPSGPAFLGCGDWNSHSGVGSRLCFKNRELAEYAGKQFISIYTDFLTL